MGAITDATCGSSYRWMNNLRGQSPCLLTSLLSVPCSDGNWYVPRLNSTLRYLPPTTWTANYCICSWAVYNLLGACTACQDNENINDWTYYVNGCGPYITFSPFPTDRIIVPNGTSIPYWAGIDPSTWTNQLFDVTQAQVIYNRGYTDIDLSSKQGVDKSGPPIGRIFIFGVVFAAVEVIVLSAIVIFCYTHRRRRIKVLEKGALDPLLETRHSPSLLHDCSPSDVFEMTDIRPTTYVDNDQSTPTGSPHPSNDHINLTLQTDSSNYSDDVSSIDRTGLGTPSPPGPQKFC